MSSINVTIQILDLNQTLDAEIEEDVTVSEVIRELMNHLSLPDRDRLGQINRYKIRSKNLGMFLLDNQTLRAAAIPAGDVLVLHREEIAGGGDETRKTESRIKFDKSSIGLSLDSLDAVDIRALLANEPALMMTLHSYKASLTQSSDLQEQLNGAEEEIRRLNDRLKEKNIAAVMLLLGQIQIGFGTNLITSGSTGGWFVFIAGLSMNLGALFFSVRGLTRRGNYSKT